MNDQPDIPEGTPAFALHEAIALVLNDSPNGTASSTYLSDEIWERQLYWLDQGKKATPDQIIQSAGEFPAVFEVKDRTTVRLIRTR